MISIVKESILECTSGLSCSLNTESIIQWIVIYPVESAIHRLNNQGQEGLQKSGLYPHNIIQDFVNDGWSFLCKFLSHCKRLFSPFSEFAKSLLEKLEHLDSIFYVGC